VTRRLFASAVVALIGLVAMVGLAPPASAHSVSGVGATNWQTTLTGVSPAVAGLTIRVVEDGSRLEIVNHGPEIVVDGYDGEPYLRVGPKGVFINTKSPAAYLNCSRNGCPVPAAADAKAPPEWQQFSTGQTVLWHDHRIHWMGRQAPPDVARDPGVRHVQDRWTVTMTQGATPITVTGELTWVPGSNPFPWLLLALALAGIGAVVALTRSWRWLALATGVVTAVDFAHAVGVAWFWAGNWIFKAAELFEGSSYQIPGWILGYLAVRLLLRGDRRGRVAAAIAGGSALLSTGVLDFTVLSRSQAPFTGPLVVDRLAVAICLGLGVGVLVGALALIRAERPKVEYDDDFEVDDAELREALEDHGHPLATADAHGLEPEVTVVEG
jgi:hypothetical protein